MIYDVIIIGAGASGVYAGLACKDIKVLILEKNKNILNKFLLTGHGKSNITNNVDKKEMMNNLINNNKFMYPAFNDFCSQEILDFLRTERFDWELKEKTKVHLVCTNHTFANRMEKKLLEKDNVELLYDTNVFNVDKQNDLFLVSTSNEEYKSKKLIIATGGLSYPKTGSNGDGYKIAKKFNHTIKTQFAIGVGIKLTNNQFKELQGLSINVSVTILINNKVVIKESGPMMFSHFGLGGPIIRRVSGYISLGLKDNLPTEIKIEFLSLPEIEAEFMQMNIKNSFLQINQKLKNILLDEINIKKDLDLNNMNKIQKEEIKKQFNSYSIKNIELLDISQAIATGGGVHTKEINPNSFESLIVPNLFFIGEVLDVNAKTNGFNLTVAFASANKCIKYIQSNLQNQK